MIREVSHVPVCGSGVTDYLEIITPFLFLNYAMARAFIRTTLAKVLMCFYG